MLVCPFLSFEQERMLFLDRLNPGNPAHHERGAIQITGRLDPTVLEQSVHEIIRRHEILRTSFTSIDGQPGQVIAASLSMSLPVYDLQEYPFSERYRIAQEQATTIVQQPFDLTRCPLWRLGLIRLEPEAHLLVISMHHIISDGDASVQLFFRELATCYARLLGDQTVSLAELTIQYQDFVRWQRQMNQAEEQRRNLNYWKQQLEGAEPVLHLPHDHSRPPVQTFAGDRQVSVLSHHLYKQLGQVGQQTGVSLHTLLFAAFTTLLYRYTGQDDISIGSPASGRQHPGTEHLIGYFGNPLVLRTDLSGNPRFSELLMRIQTMLAQAERHQVQPFQKLVEELKPERNVSTTPLFQVLFVMREAFEPIKPADHLSFTLIDIDSGVVPYEWCLFITDTGHDAIWRWEYNSDLFERATIARMVQHLHCLLESIVADPQQRLSELHLLTPADRQQLLTDWNQTQVAYPQHCCHHLVERQAEVTPDAIAVMMPESIIRDSSSQHTLSGSVTYAQLNAYANRLAHYLHMSGVGSVAPGDSMVGICFDRSLEMMVAIVGVLKAGAAYVPLDLSYPPERLEYMVQDANLPVILTTETVITKFPAMTTIAQGRTIICLDRDWPAIALQPDSNPTNQVTPDQLAYVLYTSGSTGKPKGVAMGHAALFNLIWWQRQHTQLAENSEARTLQFVPVSFDVSFQEMFATWSTGGTLVLVTEATRRNPELLLYFLSEQQIARLFLPFVALQQLAEVAERVSVPLALCEVITAGEQLHSTPAIAHWFKQMPACSLYNHYGPTESHVVTTFCLPRTIEEWPALPPIGRPIDNVQIYILDHWGNPVPIGVPGELHLGGVCLARGYLHQPELTAERFIPNPFGSGRLYKTGDQARYRVDGTVEFMGRLDHQVKIRGFRVEPGEIESVLNTHPDVHECVVAVREDIVGQKRLVAYIVPTILHAQRNDTTSHPDQEHVIATSQLDPKWYTFLKEYLPEHMIPTTFVLLSALPLTPSGKINRRALPAPSNQRPEMERPLVAPQNEVEHQIATIWQAALQLEQIGIHDDFFALGGHSLLLTHVQTRLSQVFGQDISIVQLFQHPTIHALAQELTIQKTSQPHSRQQGQERLIPRSFTRQQREQRRQIRTQRERDAQ